VRANRWQDLAAVLTDAMLDELMVTARHEALADALRARYAGIAEAIVLQLPIGLEGDRAVGDVVAGLRTGA
jgi:hypothetical protein